MPPDYVNRDDVRDRVARLLDEYDRDGVSVSVSREPPAEHSSFAELRAYADDGYLGGAYALTIRGENDHPEFSDTMPDDAATRGQRVLLGLGRYDERWGPPGGGREAGETFEETAIREVTEEVGVTCEPTDVVALRRVVVEDPDSEDEIHLAYVVFEAAYVDGWIQVQETEVAGAAWFDDLPDALHPIVDPYATAWESDGAGTEPHEDDPVDAGDTADNAVDAGHTADTAVDAADPGDAGDAADNAVDAGDDADESTVERAATGSRES
jgi:8-oxo-dGTP diphosphatase